MRRLWNLRQQLLAERWPLDRLRSYQFAKLQPLLDHSYRCVPFYRSLMDARGVRPAHIKRLSDIQHLPIVDKAMMRALPEADRLSRPVDGADGITRISTSGSSGEPFGFLVDKAYNQWRKVQCLRPYLSNGRRPFQRLLHLCAFPDAPRSLPARLGLLPEVRVSSTAPAAEHVQALQTVNPHFLQGYASSLRALAMEIQRTGAVAPPLKRVFSDSEILSPEARALVESALGAPVIDIYGSFEADNIGYECDDHAGMHMALDSVIVEVVDGDQVLPPGQPGELVITILHNHLMPFIRYRTGDAVRLLADPCRCGRTFPLLQLMGGRCVHFLRLSNGGSASPGGLVRHFEHSAVQINEFKIIQTAIDAFTVRVVPSVTLAPGVLEARVRELVQAEIPAARVRVEVLAHIPRTAAGKLPVFTCEMDST